MIRDTESKNGNDAMDMEQLCKFRKQFLSELDEIYWEKNCSRLGKWLMRLECVSFSEKALSGDPALLRFAVAKFLYAGCGITRCGEQFLAVDINGDGRMMQIFSQMLQMVTPENHSVKGADWYEFLAPFKDHFLRCCRERYFLDLLKKSPKDAAIHFLVQKQWKFSGMYGKWAIQLQARKFDAAYAQFSAQQNIPECDGTEQ